MKDLTDEDINAFKDDDEELYKLLIGYANDTNNIDRVRKACDSSKNDGTKIWFFEDKTILNKQGIAT